MKNYLLYILFVLFAIPSYSQIQSYYNGLDLTKTGNELFLELANRLEETHKGIPYTGSPVDVWDACKIADEDPNISSNVILIYGFNDTDGNPETDRTRNENLQDSGQNISGVWNREHVFAKSIANPSFGTDEPGPGTDVHNLRPADRDRNSSRSNRKFDSGSGNSEITSTGGWYPGDEWKGDIARIVMYMYMRYHGDGSKVSETNCLPINIGFGNSLTIDPNMIDLFLNWNVEDPVSDFEINRNNELSLIQENRNPFIDNPYLATVIWGGINAEDKWWDNASSDTEAPSKVLNLVATETTDKTVNINWEASTDNIGVYDYLIYLDGVYLQTSTINSIAISNLKAATNYAITVLARDAASNYSETSDEIKFKTLEGPKYLLFEDFENCNELKFITYNEASNKDWECESQFGENNSGSIGINGYQQNVLSKDWLITTNPIDFENSENEKLSFYTDAAYGNSTLTLVYSNNYDGTGNPSDFTWLNVPNVSIPTHSNGSGTEEVFNFTNIDISSISGDVYVAFKYYSNNEPTRWTVDSFVITAEELSDDSDNDGILNINDLCSNTPNGEAVNETGCSIGQLDDDNDGVQNSIDKCANTPSGEDTNEDGCSSSQLDDDEDGIMNNIDICENTPIGENVNEKGCSESQLDDDNDGVTNNIDTCPNTIVGALVNATGCFILTSDNFKISSVGETCPDKNNGQLIIAPKENYNYLTTINGVEYNFTDDLEINDLAPKVYDFCISVVGEDYSQCFSIDVKAGSFISGKSNVNSNKVSIEIEKGTAPYNVSVNGINILETDSNMFNINVKQGDLVEVKTAVVCEGVYSKSINLLNGITAFPNPSKGMVNLSFLLDIDQVVIELYSIQSKLISTRTYPVISGKTQLNLGALSSGVYIAKIQLDKPVILKLIKE
ncbi:endonuclease [Lutibacter citreus]|uniref:endonuclease n=1 Tax=Lutibacter citreus TaxID=2138210 RepID=UPI001300764A|nr:endonuclease [Lutibacter citreus]